MIQNLSGLINFKVDMIESQRFSRVFSRSKKVNNISFDIANL
jgi:hypothetical protein